MTEHPLTDEICNSIAASYPYNGADIDHCEHIEDMRTAADWQLEQVIKWLEDCPIYDSIIYRGEDMLAEDLKQAMRPHEDN